MEQLSLFQYDTPAEVEAICLFHGERATAKPLTDWMKRLVPEGEYVVMVGPYPLVLRPAHGRKEDVRVGHEFYHYIVDGRLYAGIFVGSDIE